MKTEQLMLYTLSDLKKKSKNYSSFKKAYLDNFLILFPELFSKIPQSDNFVKQQKQSTQTILDPYLMKSIAHYHHLSYDYTNLARAIESHDTHNLTLLLACPKIVKNDKLLEDLIDNYPDNRVIPFLIQLILRSNPHNIKAVLSGVLAKHVILSRRIIKEVKGLAKEVWKWLYFHAIDSFLKDIGKQYYKHYFALLLEYHCLYDDEDVVRHFTDIVLKACSDTTYFDLIQILSLCRTLSITKDNLIHRVIDNIYTKGKKAAPFADETLNLILNMCDSDPHNPHLRFLAFIPERLRLQLCHSNSRLQPLLTDIADVEIASVQHSFLRLFDSFFEQVMKCNDHKACKEFNSRQAIEFPDDMVEIYSNEVCNKIPWCFLTFLDIHSIIDLRMIYSDAKLHDDSLIHPITREPLDEEMLQMLQRQYCITAQYCRTFYQKVKHFHSLF